MKKIGKIILIISICLMVIGIVFVFISNKKKTIDYSSLVETNKLEANNLSITMLYDACIVSFEVNRQNLNKVNYEYYDFYILNANNDLLYAVDGKTIGSGGFENDKYKFDLELQIHKNLSSAVNVKVSFKGNPYKYNKDIRKTIKNLPMEDQEN